MAIELLDVDAEPSLQTVALGEEYISPRNSIYVGTPSGDWQRAKATHIYKNGRWVLFWSNEWVTSWYSTITLEVPVTYLTHWNSIVNHSKLTSRVTNWITRWSADVTTTWYSTLSTGRWTRRYTTDGPYGRYTDVYTTWNYSVTHQKTTTANYSRNTSKTIDYTTYWDTSHPMSRLTEKITRIQTQVEVARWTKH